MNQEDVSTQTYTQFSITFKDVYLYRKKFRHFLLQYSEKYEKNIKVEKNYVI